MKLTLGLVRAPGRTNFRKCSIYKNKMLVKKAASAGKKKKRLPPPKVTAYSRLHDPHGCVAMIEVFDKFNKLDLALDLYHEIIEEAKLSRSVLPQYIVNCIIVACGNGGAWEIACHIYNDALYAPNVRFVTKRYTRTWP